MPIIAKYPQRCGWCDNDIEPGDEIAEVDDEWVHSECAADAGVSADELAAEADAQAREP